MLLYVNVAGVYCQRLASLGMNFHTSGEPRCWLVAVVALSGCTSQRSPTCCASEVMGRQCCWLFHSKQEKSKELARETLWNVLLMVERTPMIPWWCQGNFINEVSEGEEQLRHAGLSGWTRNSLCKACQGHLLSAHSEEPPFYHVAAKSTIYYCKFCTTTLLFLFTGLRFRAHEEKECRPSSEHRSDKQPAVAKGKKCTSSVLEHWTSRA